MKAALAGAPENSMPRPDGVEDRLINKETGEPTMPGSENAVFEFFRSENAPSTQPRATPDTNGKEEAVATETIF
jgi:penicillin-binding protein 1A